MLQQLSLSASCVLQQLLLWRLMLLLLQRTQHKQGLLLQISAAAAAADVLLRAFCSTADVVCGGPRGS